MTIWTLIQRSLRFYWLSHLGVLAGSAVGAAVLIGALAVGDSLRGSLRDIAIARVGRIDLALVLQDGYFHQQLADDLSPSAPILLTAAVAGNEADDARANNIQVVGADDNFWNLAPMECGGSDAALAFTQPNQSGVDAAALHRAAAAPLAFADPPVLLNDRLARQLRVAAGDTILLRLTPASLLPGDAPLSLADRRPVAYRLRVAGIASDDQFGRFSLHASQVPPYNAFVPLAWLQETLRLAGRANALLVRGRSIENAQQVLAANWRLDDFGLDLQQLTEPNVWQLTSERIFLPPTVAPAASRIAADAVGVFTYFVNTLRVGDRAAPYSMVTALSPLHPLSATSQSPPNALGGSSWDSNQSQFPGIAPAALHLKDDQILLNRWLADDLNAKPGDTLEMTYFVLGPTWTLQERTSRFVVSPNSPIEVAALDKSLMPDFPGIAEANDCRQWKPGIPIDLARIRQKDQDYWSQYRGTPKAVISLAAAQKLWGNRFGDLTAVRFAPLPAPASSLPGAEYRGMGVSPMRRETVSVSPPRSITNGQKPVPENTPILRSNALQEPLLRQLIAAGLPRFQPVRQQALAAGEQAMDFGGLFLGFSIFLVAAALLLTALMLAFALQQRAAEVGTLLAIGYSPRRVRRLLLLEGLAPAAVGVMLGAAAGALYTKAMLYGLKTIWRQAVHTSDIHFHLQPLTLAVGAGASMLLAVGAMWLVLRNQARRPVRELLAPPGGAAARGMGVSPMRPKGVSPLVFRRKGETETDPRNMGRTTRLQRFAVGIAAALALAAVTLVLSAGAGRGRQAAGAFFASGALLLLAGLAAAYAWLLSMARPAPRPAVSVARLGLRNAVRRVGRSLAVVALLAAGSFLVAAVGANRHDPARDAQRRDSGTGGFAFIAQTTAPLFGDLADPARQKAINLDPNQLAGMSVVPIRRRDGDDASCLNLNRPQQPQLLAVDPNGLQARGAFAFSDALGEPNWTLLHSTPADGAIPAVVDQTTAEWALGLSLGDTIQYTDEQGKPFRVRLAGLLAPSVLQGGVLISQSAFLARYPSASGYRMSLIDAPPGRSAEIAAALAANHFLRESGLELVPAADRLAELEAVENTYLSIFQLLGGLGMILGSAGLAVIVARNVLERRGELALLRAVGFPKRTVQWMVLCEHLALVAGALAVGIVAAAVAVLPALGGHRFQTCATDPVPYASLAVTIAAIAAASVLWTVLATALAPRGPLLPALRNE